MKNHSLFVVAGEVSGDIHAGNMLSELTDVFIAYPVRIDGAGAIARSVTIEAGGDSGSAARGCPRRGSSLSRRSTSWPTWGSSRF